MKTLLMPTQLIDVQKQMGTEDLPNYSDPGTGKTLTTIGSIEAMKFQSGLVIGPVISLPMWCRTISLELGAKVQHIKKGSDRVDLTADFHVMSYSMATSHFAYMMEQRHDALVLDESHYLASPESLRTRSVYGPRTDGNGGLFSTSRYCFTLTGTPITRYQDDVWAQLRALHPTLLQKYGVLEEKHFKDTFTYQGMKQYNPRMRPSLQVIRSKNEDLFRKMVFEDLGAIKRTIADVDAFMPPVTFRHVDTAFKTNPDLTALVRHKNVHDVETLLNSGDLAMTTARRLLGVAKAQAASEYVLSLAATDQVLVGYWHTEVGEAIVSLLRREGINAQLIGGKTSSDDRDQIVQGFETGEVRVIVGQMMAAGVSLNLQKRCRNVVLAELDYSPTIVNQFFKRVWRLGQTQHTQVDYCVADHIVDHVQMKLLDGKQTSINIGSGQSEDMGFAIKNK